MCKARSRDGRLLTPCILLQRRERACWIPQMGPQLLFYGRRHIRGIIMNMQTVKAANSGRGGEAREEMEGFNDDSGSFPWIDAIDALAGVHGPTTLTVFLSIFDLPPLALRRHRHFQLWGINHDCQRKRNSIGFGREARCRPLLLRHLEVKWFT